MKHEKIEYTCDIDKCGQFCLPGKDQLQVIFTTEQNEGRPRDRYLHSFYTLDLCDDCKKHLLKGNYVCAYGAQGYNTYYFENPKK